MKQISKKLIIIFVITLSFILGVYFFNDLKIAEAQNSSDAIAIRVISNPKHLSAYRWYTEQKFTGSPQSTTVDGYEAVRDGRSVYVNAANINLGKLYTNIYLISYNQDAESATLDIFASILSKWKFNTNISGIGHCREESDLFCSSDNDCPIGDYCDNPKARIIRDTLRLSNLVDTKTYLNNFKTTNKTYPILSAGTYLSNKTISTWPSWRDTFGKDLGISIPLDPVNVLGVCPGFDERTCWNEKTKKYVLGFPEMPENSLAYSYFTDKTGSDLNLCAVYEAGLVIPANDPRSTVCVANCLDFDSDGYGNPASGKCDHPELDCDDTNPSVTTGGTEDCYNGIDDDCDGLPDCNDMDCTASPACMGIGICDYDGICESGEDCTSCAVDGCCGPPTCPDSFCDTSCECSTCVADCSGNPGCCGQAGCNPGIGECSTCMADCNANIVNDCCGNGVCDTAVGENMTNCASDCAAACSDVDGDFYISGSGSFFGCTLCGPAHNIACSGNNDCDDSNSAVHPGASELCNGLDDDCDSSTDEGFTAEACGFVCTAAGYNWNNSRAVGKKCCGNDSNEGNPSASTYFPFEAGHCSDSIDNDCDGDTDMDDSECSGSCGYSNETNWNIIGQPDCNQCDHEGDDDGDQIGSWSIYPGMADKCDSDCGIVSATVSLTNFQFGTETTCDNIDNDCDGTVDEGLTGAACSLQQGVCAGSTQKCIGGSWQSCNTSSYGANYDGATEVRCSDGLDNDCDGLTDSSDPDCLACVDADVDGHYAISGSCPGGDDCDDTNKYEFPGNSETCDTNDNDCDGTTDEGCDDDGDGYCDSTMTIYNNTSMCPNTVFAGNGMLGNDCNDSTAGAGIHPGATELCDGTDNDCNPSTADGSGETWYEAGTELTCTDSKDNDCDGTPDTSDSDCNVFCNFIFNFPCEFSP